MFGSFRDFLRVSLLLPMGIAACASGIAPEPTSSVETKTNTGGHGGSDLGPCGVDCSQYETPPCTVSVCNTGQEIGPINSCVVVPAPNGTACDDGLFCTINDSCKDGACTGGTPNNCASGPTPCFAVICYEDTKSCDSTPVNDGTPCTPTNLCQVNGVCKVGDCVGEPKDCAFSPLSECNDVSCDPATGKCVGTPDPAKDDAPCVLTGELCKDHKTCKTGQCVGGVPKDCSAFDVGCEVGVCEVENGGCVPAPAPVGTVCTEGIPECHVGACDTKGECHPSAAPDGASCNDHNGCSQGDTCVAGACTGSPVAGCTLYLLEGFETCPNGWTLSGDWECGAPSLVGPIAAHTGTGALATQIDGFYSVNQSFATTTADSPIINLSSALSPMVSFWAWQQTEGGTFDGWNLSASINGGQSFTQVTTVSPAYDLTIAGKPSWGGDKASEGWQNYLADLTAFSGHPVILRFAFRSDGATVLPGVYIDDIIVGEPHQIPLFISTASPLLDTYAQLQFSSQITKTGGTTNVVWSLKPGGTNTAWLSIDPVTGTLKGTPAETELGPVSVTVHVEEATLPSNFSEKTFTFNVKHAKYYTSFEGACPAGWTLTGDWQCGVPTGNGPGAAYVGNQCLATQIGGDYSDLQTFSQTTATSPDIDLTNVGAPVLAFRMWVNTEGSSYDGANLQVSTDGGMNFTILETVTPYYPLTIAGKPAWGGNQSALGWQLVQGDLSAYAGQHIRLRFAFQSDSSGTFPGVYIDDFFVD